MKKHGFLKSRINKKIILIFLLTSLELTKDVYAYVDPGVGGTLYQVIILVLGMVGVLFVSLRSKLFRIFRKKKSKKNKQPAENQPHINK